jgi:hypothetical protein
VVLCIVKDLNKFLKTLRHVRPAFFFQEQKGEHQICHADRRRKGHLPALQKNSTTPVRAAVPIVHQPTGHQSTIWGVTTGAREMRSQDPPPPASPPSKNPRYPLASPLFLGSNPIPGFSSHGRGGEVSTLSFAYFSPQFANKSIVLDFYFFFVWNSFFFWIKLCCFLGEHKLFCVNLFLYGAGSFNFVYNFCISFLD